MALRLVEKKESYSNRTHRETLERFGGYAEKSELLHKWQSLRVYHPQWGSVLVTQLIDRNTCVVDILSDDFQKTIFKQRVHISDLKRDFTWLDRLTFASRTFFRLLNVPLRIHKD